MCVSAWTPTYVGRSRGLVRRLGGSAWWVGLQSNVVIMTPARQRPSSALRHHQPPWLHRAARGCHGNPRRCQRAGSGYRRAPTGSAGTAPSSRTRWRARCGRRLRPGPAGGAGRCLEVTGFRRWPEWVPGGRGSGGRGERGSGAGYRLRRSNPAPSAAAKSLRSNAAKATGAGLTLSRSQRAEAR